VNSTLPIRHEPRVVPRPEHTVSRSDISSGALKVLYRLHRSGYLAYLVGGGVRDLLLGKRPKDFDVVTNARPQEIRRLFRNSRIIGRRFRLVHVMFADGIVEVATFRASPEPPEVPDGWEEGEESELATEAEETPREAVVETEVFGSPAEDAWRRDFTVNALFYNIADYSILDYVGGMEDLEARVLRSIGPPDLRFREDPVRMLRALEYMVRLEFELEPELEAAIHRNRELILDASPARLAYELLEVLKSGSAHGICSAWRRFGILKLVFPEAEAAGSALGKVLRAADRRVAMGFEPHDAVLLGASFLPAFAGILARVAPPGQRVDNPALLEALDNLLEPPAARLHISNRNLHLMKQGMFTISKMLKAPEKGRQVTRLARQEYFPVAWQLYTLAVESELLPREPWEAWNRALDRLRTHGTAADPGTRARRDRRPRRRRRRR